MILTIESTRTIVTVDGVACRVWDGETDDGVRCTVLVHKIAVDPKHGVRFERDLDCAPDPTEAMTVTITPGLRLPVSPPGRAPGDPLMQVVPDPRGACVCCLWCCEGPCEPAPDRPWVCAQRCMCDVPGGPR